MRVFAREITQMHLSTRFSAGITAISPPADYPRAGSVFLRKHLRLRKNRVGRSKLQSVRKARELRERREMRMNSRGKRREGDSTGVFSKFLTSFRRNLYRGDKRGALRSEVRPYRNKVRLICPDFSSHGRTLLSLRGRLFVVIL